MRKSLLGLALFAPLACSAAVTVSVEANTVLRLPVKGDSLSLDRISVGPEGALLIPSRVKELKIGELDLAKNARIGVSLAMMRCRSKCCTATSPTAA